jgi:hypothetical protein
MTRDGNRRTLKVRGHSHCGMSEKTDTVFREITTGKVDERLEKAALLKALRIERERPTRPQRIN